MKIAMNVVVAVCLTTGVASVASADPILTANVTNLGSGVEAWDFFFDGNDGLNASGAVDLKFHSGCMKQVPTEIAGLTTTTLSDFQAYEFFGPDPVYDSYLYQGSVNSAFIPFTATGVWNQNLPTSIDNPNGAAGGPASSGVSGDPMWLTAGTPGGVGINTEQIAHIVVEPNGSNEPLLEITGRIARGGATYDVDWYVGQFIGSPITCQFVPEPSSIVMCGMGVVVLVCVGWRRRRSMQENRQ